MIAYPELSRAGRLGNQLWEIASTIGLAVTHADRPSFPKWDYQPYFSVPGEFFVDEPHGTLATDLVPHLDHRASAYLQDYSLWSHAESQIRSYFEPSTEALDILRDHQQWMDALPRPLVSIHVRRGDNVTHPPGYHPLRSMEYYQRAFELLRPDLGQQWSTIVFSDDPDWCEEHFEAATGIHVSHIFEGVARPREYVDRQLYEDAPVLDWVDLQLMAQCDHLIISNSTYAWWGAYLSNDPSPIYPSRWFGWHIRDWTDASLMFPSTWREVHDPTQGGA